MPAIALTIVAIGLLWMGMSRGHWRWLGAAAIAGAMTTAWTVPRPDILLSPSGKLVAFRSPDSELILSSNRAERLVRDTWLRRNGQVRFDDIGDLVGTESWLGCRENICDYARRVRVFLAEPSGECGNFELVIVARSVASDACKRAARVIDQSDLSARGSHAIYLRDGKLEIIDAASRIGDRPWARPVLSSNDVGAVQ